jgi:hypothetical protein
MMTSLNIKNINSKENLSLLVLSIGLSIPAILLGENLLLALPVVILIMLSFVLGERFILAIIIISLFTLVGELNRSLRTVVQFVDFTLLGILFLKRFGLNINSYPRVPKSVIYFLILYFSALIISAVMSRYPFAGIGIITQQLAFFIVAYVFYSLIEGRKDIILYFKSIFIVAGILATLSIATMISEGVSILDIVSQNRERISAIMGNIEAATNFYIVSIPIVISFLILKKDRYSKIFNQFLLFYFGLGLILAMSRSAIMGIIVSSAIIFYLLKRNRFYQLLSYNHFACCIFLFYQPLNEFLTTFLRIESGMSARDYVWKMSMDMIKDHTIFGIGPGAYQYEMINYFPYMLDDWWGKLFIYLNGKWWSKFIA